MHLYMRLPVQKSIIVSDSAFCREWNSNSVLMHQDTESIFWNNDVFSTFSTANNLGNIVYIDTYPETLVLLSLITVLMESRK